MSGKPSQRAKASTLIEAKKRSSFVIRRGSNNTLDRSAVSALHMSCSSLTRLQQRARSALALNAEAEEASFIFAAPSRPAPSALLHPLDPYCDKMSGRGGGF
jgi:hypothetical protein